MTPDLPLTPDERRQLRARLELGGGGIPLAEGYEVVMRLLATADALEAERAHLRATVCQVPEVAQCAQLWEADHQQGVLQGLGLAEEFPFGCDAIEQVAAALVAVRQALAQARADCTAALERQKEAEEARAECDRLAAAVLRAVRADCTAAVAAAYADAIRMTQDEVRRLSVVADEYRQAGMGHMANIRSGQQQVLVRLAKALEQRDREVCDG